MKSIISDIEFNKLIFKNQSIIHKICNIYTRTKPDKEDKKIHEHKKSKRRNLIIALLLMLTGILLFFYYEISNLNMFYCY